MTDIIKKIHKRLINSTAIKTIITILVFIYLFVLNWYFSLPIYGYYHQLVIVLTILAIWMVLPKIADIIFLSLFTSIYSFYLLAQIVYYRGFESYFYLRYGLSMRNEVVGVISSVFELIRPLDYLMIIMMIIVLIISVYLRIISLKRKTNIRINLIVSLSFLILVIASLFGFQHKLASTDIDSFLYNESDRYVYDTLPSTEVYVDKFGINAFLLRDLYDTLLEARLHDYDDKIKAIDEYLLKKTTNKNINDYTGIFKDKNLIIIQAESLTNIGVDSELTPTLQYFMETGMYFSNFSAPLLPGSTSDTEIMIQNSLYPKTDGYATMHAYATNTYPLTLAKVFKDNDYKTDIFHNNYGTYYNRNVFYGNDAYDKFFEPVELGLEDMCSDLTMLGYSSWIVAEKEKFFSYFITYSGHQPYNFISTKDLTMAQSAYDEYMGYVKVIDEKYPNLDEFTRAYLAKSISLDRGLEQLMIALDTYGRLDDTVIVIFGDHMIKGYKDAEHQDSLEILDISEATIPLIIWNSSISSSVIDKYCNSLDVLPTLLNMFDVDYDKKLAFGFDILDQDYIGYYFDVNGAITSNKFYYDLTDGLMVEDGMSKSEANYWIEYFQQLKTISSYIIETDYFSNK